MTQETSNVSRILNRIEHGESLATEELLPLVYQQLRQIAHQKLADERPGQTLQATALVHDAFLRMLGRSGESVSWKSRGHFFAAAAESMRRILIDNARRKKSSKRGGDRNRVDFPLDFVADDAEPNKLLALDKALIKFEQLDPQKAELIKLRFFAGLTIEQAARALGISTSAAGRHWAYARSWLQMEIKADDG